MTAATLPAATLLSVQIGSVRHEPEEPEKRLPEFTSAFGKQPVDGPVHVTDTHIEGDQFANPKAHGGTDKAVLCYAAKHYRSTAEDSLQKRFPDCRWSPGALGENWTVEGLSETNVCVGDVFRVGQTRVQVSQPRQPCWKINRFHRQPKLLKTISETGRTGWYLRVLQTGPVQAGDPMSLEERPHPDWSIERLNDFLFGRRVDLAGTMELMAIAELADAWKDAIA